MTQIILHHYASSPFSEKIRVCFGLKGLDWAAVEQPVIMPKPDLVPLTGGYRRIPVMQIGADIYCDSVLIAAELERRFPDPSFFPAGNTGTAAALQYWTDREIFQAAVAVIFAGLGEAVDPAFIKDREALSGRPFDPAAMGAAVPMMRTQIRAYTSLLEAQLADGRAFLDGSAAGLADASAYYNYWFIKAAYPPEAEFLRDFPRAAAWIDRVAGLGHGRRTDLSAAEALTIATDATPDEAARPAGAHPLLGQKVAVAAIDYGFDPNVGTLVAASDTQLSIARQDEALGDLVVHFPTVGFAVSPV